MLSTFKFRKIKSVILNEKDLVKKHKLDPRGSTKVVWTKGRTAFINIPSSNIFTGESGWLNRRHLFTERQFKPKQLFKLPSERMKR